MSRNKVYVHNARQCGKRSQNIDRLIELIEEGKIIMKAPSKDDCLDEIQKLRDIKMEQYSAMVEAAKNLNEDFNNHKKVQLSNMYGVFPYYKV